MFLTVKVPESVLCEKTFAAIGSIPGLAPPHIIDIDAVGATAVLLENLSLFHILQHLDLSLIHI